MSRRLHKTIPLKDPDGHIVDIDVKIAELMLRIWGKKYNTTNSCQDNVVHGEHFVWIEFAYASEGMRFVEDYIGNNVNKLYDVGESWEISLLSLDLNDLGERRTGPVDLIFTGSVRFPVDQLPQVMKYFSGK